MRFLAARNTWRDLGGFGHLPQYTAIKSKPGFSYHRHVLNRFARFKFFAEQTCEERPQGSDWRGR